MTANEMRLTAAVDVVARHVVHAAVLRAIDFEHVSWEDYPEIGEHDWAAVVKQATVIAESLRFQDHSYKVAYEHLRGRADSGDPDDR